MALARVARAAWAADPTASRGRLIAEAPSLTRSDFRRDCDRIIHAAAFRRLAHKTQVFVYHEGDHYRTRLTHTLEVTQIARALARALGLDEDLAEATALGHDLGHPPFGHAGERALDACLARHGGFDHNAQTFAVVTRLERRYAAFDGLNLTWDTLEGLVKHNGPLTDREGHPRRAKALPREIADYDRRHDLALWSYPSAEAQVAAIADDIAYDAHDIDDGVRAELFALDDMAKLPLVGEALGEIDHRAPGLDATRRVHELVRRMITRMIDDVIAESGRRIAALTPRSVEDVRCAPAAVVGFSAPMQAADRAVKDFLLPRVYRQARVARIMDEAEAVVRDLFGHYTSDPTDLPAEWSQDLEPADADALPRRVADYIAGMTDPFAVSEHRRYFPATPELR
jgi:dGTPase